MQKIDNKHGIITKASEALFKNVADSPLTIDEISKRADMSSGYLKQLKKGERRLNIIYLYSIAIALNKLPSEVLPIEWQKPTEALDEDCLQQALVRVLNAKKAEMDAETVAALTTEWYKALKLSKEKGLEAGEKEEVVK